LCGDRKPTAEAQKRREKPQEKQNKKQKIAGDFALKMLPLFFCFSCGFSLRFCASAVGFENGRVF